MLLANVAVYACGLIWLRQAIPVPWTGAGATVLHYGLWPFVLGDLAKIFAAAAVADPARRGAAGSTASANRSGRPVRPRSTHPPGDPCAG